MTTFPINLIGITRNCIRLTAQILGLLENADTDVGQRALDTGQTMEKTDKRWERRTNDGKDKQTMEKTDKRWKRRTNGVVMRTIDQTST